MGWSPLAHKPLSPQAKARRQVVRLAGKLTTPMELFQALQGLPFAERTNLMTIIVPALPFALTPEGRAWLEGKWALDDAAAARASRIALTDAEPFPTPAPPTDAGPGELVPVTPWELAEDAPAEAGPPCSTMEDVCGTVADVCE